MHNICSHIASQDIGLNEEESIYKLIPAQPEPYQRPPKYTSIHSQPSTQCSSPPRYSVKKQIKHPQHPCQEDKVIEDFYPSEKLTASPHTSSLQHSRSKPQQWSKKSGIVLPAEQLARIKQACPQKLTLPCRQSSSHSPSCYRQIPRSIPSMLHKCSQPTIVQPVSPICSIPSLSRKCYKHDFITENIASQVVSPPSRVKQQIDWTKKKDYGRSPDYLIRKRNEEQRAYKDMQKEYFQCLKKSNNIYELPKKEVEHLLRELNEQKMIVNKEYHRLTYLTHLDTRFKQLKQQQLESKLAQIEEDIQSLSVGRVFVDKSQ